MKISVVSATWNCLDTIKDCITSVSEQSYAIREHVVVDGASTDGTAAYLHSVRHMLSSFVSEPDNGIYDALNKGIARCSGDVVGFLHADDVYGHPDVLRNVAQAFSDPKVCAVYGDLQYVKKQDTSAVVRHWQSSTFSAQRLAWGWMPPHPTLYVRREWYERIAGFDTRYRIAADYFSVLQLFSQPGFKAVYLPEVMVKMRLGGASNRSIANIIRKSREDLDALRRSNVGALGGLGALFWKNVSKLGQFCH